MSVPPSRRMVSRTITAIVALAASALLVGCGATSRPTPEAPAVDVPSAGPTPRVGAAGVEPPKVVMIIRHGEKPEGDSGPGVDANGDEDDSSLTEVGWDRARRLVDLFDPADTPRPGMARPAAIYAAHANENGEGQRTRETVQPLSDELGIPVNTEFGKGDEEALVEHVVARPGPTLISWAHSEIPSIAEAFPSVSPNPPAEWPDDRYDVVWILTESADGWRFSQIPELLLPEDRTDVIEED